MKVIQVIDVNSEGTHVRLEDGSRTLVPHPHVPHIGEEVPGQEPEETGGA